MHAKKPEPTAAETYARRSGDIARLLDALGQERAPHRGGADDPRRAWGKAGDLGRVRRDLSDLVAFISGQDPEDVERFLAEGE